VVEVSALRGTNLAHLKRALLAYADAMATYLHPDATSERAECTVIEAHQQPGLGRLLRVIVHWGSLRPDQWFVTDRLVGRVRALLDDDGRPLTVATPGQAVSVAGLRDDRLPPSGAGLFALPREEAEAVRDLRQLMLEFKFKEMHGLLYLPDAPALTAATDTALEDEAATDGDVEGESETAAAGALSEGAAVREVVLEGGIKMVYSTRLRKWRRVVDAAEEEAREALSVPVVIKADNVGRLETLLALLETMRPTADEHADAKLIKAKEVQETKETKEANETKDTQETKETKETQETLEAGEGEERRLNVTVVASGVGAVTVRLSHAALSVARSASLVAFPLALSAAVMS